MGMVLANATFLTTNFLIGFLHAPYWVFLVALLALSIVLHSTSRAIQDRGPEVIVHSQNESTEIFSKKLPPIR